MFRNNVVFPVTDINPCNDINDMDYEKDSVGRPKNAQPVDQFDAQPFMMGENGFRRSDIAILASAESDDLKSAIAARMQQIQTQYPDQNLSDAELAALTIPRNCQSSSAFREWAASLEKSGFAKSVNEFIEAHKPKETVSETKIDFSENKSE